MVNPFKKRKGFILVVVLLIILVSVLLGIGVIRLITSQATLTQHQIVRIQAYYASKAAINYTLEQLRTGALVAGTDCTPAAPCNATQVGLNLSTDFRPAGITSLSLVITPAQNTVAVASCYRNPLDTRACVSCTASYQVTP